MLTMPTMLTLFRLIISPLVFPALLVYLAPLNVVLVNAALAAVFLLISLTDFLDGHLARAWNQVTPLGKVLDPIADKFLLYAALIGLLASGKLFFMWAIIFIGREFFVMGIRLLAYEHKFSVPVVWFGKLKTFVQTAYITAVIVNPYHSFTLKASLFNQVEAGLLAAALFLSLWTAYRYYRIFVRDFVEHHEKPEQAAQ